MKNPSYKPSALEIEFEAYQRRLRDELNTASWHFAIWKHLQNLRKDYLRELNQAPAFFQLTMRAHFLETVMRLCKFFDDPEDKKGDSLSIYEFLKFVEQNRHLFYKKAILRRIQPEYDHEGKVLKSKLRSHKIVTSGEIQRHRSKIERLPIKNLRKLRHKSFAHIDKKFVQKDIDVFKKYPVKISDIDKTIEALHRLLNRYNIAYDSSGWHKDIPLEYGVYLVVDSIRYKIDKEREQWFTE